MSDRILPIRGGLRHVCRSLDRSGVQHKTPPRACRSIPRPELPPAVARANRWICLRSRPSRGRNRRCGRGNAAQRSVRNRASGSPVNRRFGMDDGMAAPARVIREIRTRAPAARQGRPLVIVLGAEGSGISLCSRVLSALGVEMTNSAARPQAGRSMRNGAGESWERPEISGLHDRLLALFGVDPGDDFELPVSWWADPRVAEIRGRWPPLSTSASEVSGLASRIGARCG
jgi:hypothetical protein